MRGEPKLIYIPIRTDPFKYKVKHKLFIGLLTVLLAFSALIVGSRAMKKPSLTPLPRTANLLCSVLDDYDGLSELEKRQFMSALKKTPDSLSINRTLVKVLRARTNNLWPMDISYLSNSVLVDAWGSPLHFSMTNSATNGGLAPLLKFNDRPFVSWSSGPNRINEFGSGDDILPIGR
jgi:hypothetical protein